MARTDELTASTSLGAIVRLIRPRQWTKNLLVFAALLFTAGFQDPAKLQAVLLAFTAMCFVSSSIYVLNDLVDVERDRRHPKKRFRPIASGEVSPGVAKALCGLLAAIGAALTFSLGHIAAQGIVLGYVALQGLYNLWLKRQPILDVFTIALGFILRAWLGAAVLLVPISAWLLFCTGALALLLGFGKRRHEFLLQGEDRESSRESLGHYSKTALDGMVLVAAGSAAMSYGIYAIDSPTAAKHPALVFTCLFVFYGIYRYVFLLFANGEGGEPENVLLKDPHILTSVVLFVITAALAMTGLQAPFIEGGSPK
jgi:4-hydroxybenzoate polyprenyltransferase